MTRATGDDDYKLLVSWFTVVGQARRAATWMRWFGQGLGVLVGLGVILGIIGAVGGEPTGILLALGIAIQGGVIVALLFAGAALLDVHAARLDLAIHDSPMSEGD